MKRFSILFTFLFLAIWTTVTAGQTLELEHFPLDSLDGIISRTNVHFDSKVSWDGNGSVRATVDEPITLRLFEIHNPDIEKARLLYNAKLRTENITGNVYLEMWCRFPGKGEYFSRALHQPLFGTNAWLTQEIPFFLKEGQKPNMIKLNVVIDGKGIVWIDDIHLVKGEL